MTTFRELLVEKSKQPIRLLSTATTGLSPVEDELLAVSVITLTKDGSKRASNQTLIRKTTSDEKLLKSQEYHGITREKIMIDGMSDELFTQSLAQLVTGEVFTYNPAFQAAFLQPYMGHDNETYLHNLPQLVKAAEMRSVMLEKEIKHISDIEKRYDGKVPGFKRLCDQYEVFCANPALLPCEVSCLQLQWFWNHLDTIPALVQLELF